MRLDKLLERLDYEVVQGTDQTEITTLINDSRKAEKGSVFVCISGAVSDGHSYAADVAAKGAAALVVEHNVDVPEDLTVIIVKDTRYALALMSAAYFGYPAEKMKIIGITGKKNLIFRMSLFVRSMARTELENPLCLWMRFWTVCTKSQGREKRADGSGTQRMPGPVRSSLPSG